MKKTIIAFGLTTVLGAGVQLHTEAASLELEERYNSGVQNEDGGTTEIVSYNAHNQSYYVVNGTTKKVEAVSLTDLTKPYVSFDVEKALAEIYPDFTYGDLSSISVSPKENIIAIAVQAAGYNDAGLAVIINESGQILHVFEAGIQPDNITFTPDGSKILVANEGEPREGYEVPAVDPQGTISVIDLTNGIENAKPNLLTFEAFDSAAMRQQLVNDEVILKKNTNPSVDLEPEYIAVDENSRYAYVALQENNAIATIDLQKQEIISVKGLGTKDHSQQGNELDLLKDGKAQLKNENYHGLYMPDGIAVYTVAGKNYIVTANEGDAREWGNHLNEREVEIDGNEIVLFDTTDYEGLNQEINYIFGGRSFSIFDAHTLELVFDSGSDFERVTAQRYPQNFNASNTNVKLDSRSGKKGPEPEDVKLGEVDGKIYAFIGLERIGGIMMYDITNPAKSRLVDYLNTREYSADIAGDVSPEGLAFVNGNVPKLIIGHEVSGTVSVYNVQPSEKRQATFTDIQNNPHKQAIEQVYAAGLMNGVSVTQFNPEKPMTRAQLAVTLQRYTKGMVSEFEQLADIADKAHYAAAMQWALYTNVLASHKGKMNPQAPISRIDITTALYEILKVQGVNFTPTTSSYTDVVKLSEEQRQAVAALNSLNILTVEDNEFNPEQIMTRGEVATEIVKLLQYSLIKK